MTLSLPPSDRPSVGRIAHISPTGLPRPVPLTGADGLAEPEGPDWRRIWSAIRHWRWLVAGFAVAGAAGGVLASRVVKPRYLAQATIWIDSRERRTGGPEPFQSSQLLDPEAWLDLARSYAVLDEAARGARLYLRVSSDAAPLVTDLQVGEAYRAGVYRLVSDGDTYLLETKDGIELDRAPAGDSLGSRLGLRWVPPASLLPPGGSITFEVVPLRDAASQLSDQLELHIDPDGNLLRMQLEGTDRERLVATLDRVAQQYVNVAGDLKRQKVTQLTTILTDQLASAAADLARAESTYQAFRARTILLPSERQAPGSASTPAGGGDAPQDPVVDRYFALQARRSALHRDRESIERALGSGAGGGLSVEALTAVASARESRELGSALDDLVTKETELRAMRARYSDVHPSVIQLRESVDTLRATTVPNLARAFSTELLAQERIAAKDESGAGAQLQRLPARSLDEARLRRTVALAEDLHNTLQLRHEEARLAEASTIPDARVLDRAAVPNIPIRDTGLRFMAMTFLACLGAGLVTAVLLDRADPRFRYPSQVARDLGLPIIGAIPHLATSVRPKDDHTTSVLVEALRGVRMSLLTDLQGASPLLLTVSSPGSGDGKSFVSSHLAFAFAEAGYRTLLIDGDMRRGHLHRRFGLERRPGLCDVLRGTIRLEEGLRVTDYPGLTILPCGTRATQAPELLAGPAMAAVMAEVRRRYQVVICDSPPLTAGIDPYVLAVATKHLLLVLRSGVSHRETMAARLGVLDRMPVDLVGAVMNDVPNGELYGQYSYHLEGYEATEEQEDGTSVVSVVS